MPYSLMNLLRNTYPRPTTNRSFMPTTGIANARSRGSGMLPTMGSMPAQSWPGFSRNPFLSYPNSLGLPVSRSSAVPSGPFAPTPIPGFTGTPGPYAGGTGAIAPYQNPYQSIAPASQPTGPVPYYYNKGGY